MCGVYRSFVFVSMQVIRGLFWPLGDKGSNKDVRLFQHPSADMFSPSFTTSLSVRHESSRLVTHTHTHTKNYPRSLLWCSLTNQSRAWNPELQRSEPRLSLLVTGVKPCTVFPTLPRSHPSCTSGLFRSTLASAIQARGSSYRVLSMCRRLIS